MNLDLTEEQKLRAILDRYARGEMKQDLSVFPGTNPLDSFMSQRNIVATNPEFVDRAERQLGVNNAMFGEEDEELLKGLLSL